MKPSIVAKRLEIKGVVQGVGFRPFLFTLARKYSFTGEVSNTSDGVLLEIEGSDTNIDRLCHDIRENSPLLASVTHIDVQDIPFKGLTSFKIVKSKALDSKATLISPDVTVCKDCVSELMDPANRRYQYPFINCTNCGPRYTIIQDVPYDRPKTSMKQFKMCDRCQAEYDNPLDRRFHAQPNACHVCGPHVWLCDHTGKVLDSEGDPVFAAARFIEEGKIVAVKGLGGFHLAVDAQNHDAVVRLRKRKVRPHKPLALMAASVDRLIPHVLINDQEERLLTSYHRPIMLLTKKEPDNGVLSPAISELNPYLGVMLPYTPLHYLLLDKGPDLLVMTSGNRSGEPLSIDNSDAMDAFSHIADYFLLHDRDIYFRADDSIMHVQEGKGRFIRRSRGFAPLPVILDRNLPPILACGGGLKSTICLTKENQAFLSQHIGDLENEKVFTFFDETIRHMKKILDIDPSIVAHDLHPGYMSTTYARDEIDKAEQSGRPLKHLAVQHHHAHAAACMAENNLDGPVIALVLDGTGYGTDGHIWGSEVLTCTYESFERHAHLQYVPMPGGDAAVHEPWRMALACLFDRFGTEAATLDIEFVRQMDPSKIDFILQMVEKRVNTPLTSGCGRMFDAVSALIGICQSISYESQAAMELEAVAQGQCADQGYTYHIVPDDSEKNNPWIIDLSPCFEGIVRDEGRDVSRTLISQKFHKTLIDAFLDGTLRVSEKSGIRNVVLSGGVFHNSIMLHGILQGLSKKGLTVFTHSKVPAGDGGIALGQSMIAAANMA